ncbi:MAG TPA: histidine kinase [Chryseosolibacter sp.]|nr:histidine kinase [Chryseosolibacter sp.]
MRLVLSIILVSFHIPYLFGQDFKTFNFSVAEGLPSAETYEVFQDSKGFIWVASDNGVARYDGKAFEVFHIKDGLTDPVVFGFSEDQKGRIWFRTYSGKICYFENGRIRSYRYNDILDQISAFRIMSSLHHDSIGQVWFGMGEVIGKISDTGNLDTTLIGKNKLKVIQRDNLSLIGYAGMTSQVKQVIINEKYFPIQLSDTLHAYHVVRSELWNGKLLLSINNNIFEYDNQTLKKIFEGPAPIISLSRDRENNLWIGYMNNGVERYSVSLSVPNLSLLRDMSVTKVINDHERGLWISTLQNGIYYIPNTSIERYVPDLYGKITAVTNDGSDIVVGENNGRVTIIDPETRQMKWKKEFEDPVLCIHRTLKNELWIATTTRSFLFDPDKRLGNINQVGRVGFTQDGNGNTWSVNGTMLYHSDDNGNIIIGTPKNMYRSIIFHDSALLLAGRSGLDVVNKNLELIRTPLTFENIKVSQLIALNDSIVVASTIGNGFFLLNTKNWSVIQFSSANRFTADNVYSVLAKDSLIWFGTDRGIAVCSISKLLQTNIPEFNFLHARSGLASDKINRLVSGGDKIWAYTDEGISIFDQTVGYSNEIPLFTWTGVAVNNVSIDDTKRLDLGYDENNLELEYRSISYNNPYISVRYRIAATEPWVLNSTSKIILYSLAPGDYRFELQYAADNMVWKQALPPLNFSIRSPWYRQWYVYVSVVLVLLLLAYLYFRHIRSVYNEKSTYLKIINDHQQKLLQSEVTAIERERNRIAKELHDGVGTNLTAIKMSVRQLLHQHHEPFADEVEDQFQIAINEIKDIIYDLTPPSLERYGLFVALKNYINKIGKNIPIDISVKTFGNDVHQFDLNIIVFRIIQELLSNSIKHANATAISIHLNTFDDLLNIIYEDNGIGFKSDPIQNGLGLDNVESRIRSINGTSKFESGTFGVSYTIDIPLSQEIKKSRT